MNNHILKFKSVKVQNFLSIGDEIEFNFQSHYGMNYIFGRNLDGGKDGMKNGAGKSTLFCDALLFGLFGKTVKDLKKENIVNRIVGKKCTSEVILEVNGIEYTITNGAKPAFCTVISNKADKPLTKNSMAETHKFICDEILGSSYMIFKKVVVLSITDNESIYDMKTAQKREFIEKMFNLSIFGEMLKNVRTDYNTNEKHILKEQSEYTTIERDLEIYKEKIANFESDKKTCLDDIDYKIKEIEKSVKGLETDTSKYTEIFAKISSAYNTLDEQNDEYVLKERKIRDRVVQIDSLLSSKRKLIDKYKNIYNMVCDECKEALDSELNFSQTNNEIDKMVEERAEIIIEQNKICDKQKTLGNKMDMLSDKEDKLRLSITKCEQNEITIKRAGERVGELIAQRARKGAETSSFDDLYTEHAERKKTLYKALKTKIENRTYLSLMKDVLSEDGVKRYIISNVINALNNRITYYLEKMGAEYTVIFDSNFDCQFLTTTGDCEYNNFSAGEKVRLNHATMFAFQDVLSTQGNLRTNLTVCDEMFDGSADPVAIEAFLEVLRHKCDEGQTVYIISHREVVQDDEFENVIEIKKESGFTHIVSDPQGGIS